MTIQATAPNLLGAPPSPATDTTAAVTMRQGVLFSDLVQSVQNVALGSPTAGTWQAAVNGTPTASASVFNVTASALQTALEGVAGVGAGNVTVTNPTTGNYVVTFSGAALSATGASPVLSIYLSSLTGGSAVVAGSDVDVYTVPAASSVTVASGTLCNTSATAATVGIGVTPAGQTSGPRFKSMFAQTLPPGGSLPLAPFLGGDMLGPGDKVAVYSTVPGGVSCKLTGAVAVST